MTNRQETLQTILIVDDDEDLLEIIEETLKPLGHRTLLATNGEEAMGVVKSSSVGKIDLLLTDVIMPKMNGVELAEALTNQTPETKVVFMSGFLRPSPRNQNKPLYEKDFLQKPFSGQTLTKHIKKVLADSG